MTEPTPTPARRPGRHARRRAAVDRVVEEAYEAGVRDGRAEAAAQPTLPAEYTDPITNPPTPADAQAAMDTLGLGTIEAVVDPAFAYLQDRLRDAGEAPLWGRDTAMFTGAVALAIRAYARRDSGPDEWDMSRAEHEADKLRDRIARLEALLRDAEDYLRLTHAYPAAGGGHDTLGAGFSCDGCVLAKELKEARTDG